MKRSSTFNNFGKNKFRFKIKHNEQTNNKVDDSDENSHNEEDEELIIRKGGNIIFKLSVIKKKNINNFKNGGKNEEKNNKIKIEENKSIKIKKNNITQLNDEDNGQNYFNQNRKKDYSGINDNIFNNKVKKNKKKKDIEKKNKKMNNIKIYNEGFIKNQLEKEKFIKKDNQYKQFIVENNHKIMQSDNFNSVRQEFGVKRTLSLNSMKMKNFELKLIDFGCSKIFSKYKKNFKDTIGTLIYCSPEVLKNNYNKQCDIWSCGVIMYVLLNGEFPFFGKTEEQIKKKILSGKFNFNNKHFSKVSEKAKDLIKKCLIYDKNKRITAEEALKHEFFADDINPNNIFEEEIDRKKF